MLSSTSIAADEIEGTDVPVIVFVMSVSCLVVIQWITLGELVCLSTLAVATATTRFPAISESMGLL
jgi:hypothetical protein